MVILKDDQKHLPIIDLSSITENVEINRNSMEKVSNELFNVFREWGFAYIINHGIADDLISKVFKKSKEFFQLEKKTKEHIPRTKNLGYEPFGTETFDKSKPFDVKESFNFVPSSIEDNTIDDYVADLTSTSTIFFQKCKSLSFLLIKLLSMKLPVEENYLIDHHQFLSDIEKNETICRYIYYPTIEENEIMKDQSRCGEHSDYGTVTLLFQDDVGGLQVVNPAGEYIDVEPIPGSIVINSADLLEIWSAGELKSTKHRVLFPSQTDKARQSIAFFLAPDNDTNVKCLDGSNKYESVNAYDYLWKKLNETYS